MYAILVNEPGGAETSYILPTGAHTLKRALELMFSRAEEFHSEMLESGAPGAEDYIIKPHSHSTVDVIDPTREEGEQVVISFTAYSVEAS